MQNNELFFNELKVLIPQLAQIQYDLNSQIHYINEVCNKLNIPNTGINITTKITKDDQVCSIIDSLPNFINGAYNKKDIPLIHYVIGNRLGLYDGASVVFRKY